ncbi:MAG: VWA domain-containing protein [Deltaproteobacteria bacterium]|nr:VWA domain-containing protein [Deltaproteobacteria bacterium]
MCDVSRGKHTDRGSGPSSWMSGRVLWAVWLLMAFLASTGWVVRGLCLEVTTSPEASMPVPTASVFIPERTESSSACNDSDDLHELLERTDARLGESLVRFPYSLVDRKSRKAEPSLAPNLFPRGSDPGTGSLLLKKMDAEVRIVGPIAQVKLHQVFQNTGANAVDADYLFPASAGAAVHEVRVRIGERFIEARMQKRDQAGMQFEQAESKNRTVSFIEQEWPNVFLMNVVHIMPGDSVQVELNYSEPVFPQNEVYEFTLPAVPESEREGRLDPIRERGIPNRYAIKGESVPYDFDIAVQLLTAVPIKTISSPSHRISVFYRSQNSARIHLDQERKGNKDFVLRYTLAGVQIESGVMMYQGAEENYIAVFMEPPERPSGFRIPSREFIFVIDVSESMKGFPLETAKVLMERLLMDLKASDLLNVVLFAGNSAVLNSSGSVNATEENIRQAISLLDGPSGDDGTGLMTALRAAYSIPRPESHVSRSLVVITDGYVDAEAQVFKFVREHLDEANLFVFGIGVSVNRALVGSLARAGQGKPFVALSSDQAAAEAEKFRAYIKNPVLTQASVTFEGFDVHDQIPMKLPDLMAQRPIVVIAKYRGAPSGRVRISGFTGEERYLESLEASPFIAGPENAPIVELWARKWLELLEDQYLLLPHVKELEEAVTRLGLCHDLPATVTRLMAADYQMGHADGSTQPMKQTLPSSRRPSQSEPESGIKDQFPSSKTRKPLSPEVAAIAGSIRQQAQETSELTGEPPADEAVRETPKVVETFFLFTSNNLENPTALEKAVRDSVRPAAERCASSPAALTFRVEVDGYGTVIGATISQGSGERDTDACIIQGLPGIVTESRPFEADYGSLEVTLHIKME